MKFCVNKNPAGCAFSILGGNMPKEGIIGSMKILTKGEGKICKIWYLQKSVKEQRLF